MPFLFCDFNNVCNYASRNDKSYWLSTNEPIPMMPVAEHAIPEFISRFVNLNKEQICNNQCAQVCGVRGADQCDRSSQPRYEHSRLSTGLGAIVAWLQFCHGKTGHTSQFENILKNLLSSQHTAAGAEGGGQSLSSPGSCLQDFRATPFIECNGARGTCHYFANKFSFWLATIQTRNMFDRPVSQTLKAGNLRSRVSRCQVCMRRS